MRARPIAFVLGSTRHGAMILNRLDSAQARGGDWFGVGHQLLASSGFDVGDVQLLLHVLDRRRRNFGDGVVAIDGGANIGVHTIEWARWMHGWGEVHAFEAQEMLFYALAGNVALNNCMNARLHHAALGDSCGFIPVPQPDYTRPASFGSLEIRLRDRTEPIGQEISYREEDCRRVPLLSLDSMPWQRLDFIKLDVEGMEAEVLRGARETIGRHKPAMWIEVLKSEPAEIRPLLEGWGYSLFAGGINWMAVHASDPYCAELKRSGAVLVT